MKRVAVVILGLVLVLAGVLAYRMRELQAYKDAPAGGTGTVEGTKISITARIPARVVAMHVEEGDTVQEGQLLVELECDEPRSALAQARAQLATAQANVHAALAQERAAQGNTRVAQRVVFATQAEGAAAVAERSNTEKEAARLRALHEEGAISPSMLDQVQTARATSTQRVAAVDANRAAAKARVHVARENQLMAEAQIEAAQRTVEAMQAAVERAETTVRECRLTAPRAAVVQTRNYEPGEVVLPGANLLTLAYLEEVRVTFYLPNAELARAAPGRAVTVVADAYPEQSFAGTIRHVSAEAEFTPKNVQTREDRDRLVYGVEVEIPNPEGKLRPGMPVEVAIDGTGK